MAEKKGLIYKLVVGSDKAEGYARSTLPSNRWELFWDILKGRFWKLVLLNLMAIISLIPTILVFMIRSANISINGQKYPFTGGYLIGYEQMPKIYEIAQFNEFVLGIQSFVLLIPALMFAAVLLSGIFHIVRNLAWSEGVFIANDFWKGLKSNISSFLILSFLLGVVLFLANLNLSSLKQALILGNSAILSNSVVNTLLTGLTYVFAVFFSIMVLFAFTMTVTYKVKTIQLLKNAFILTLGLLPRNIFFMLLSFSPFLIIFLFPGGMLTGLLLGLILMLGFSCAILGWTVYSQWVFDMFLNDKVEGAVKNRGIYQKVDKDGKVVNKKNVNKFSNPKKKRAVKPVTDEEITITELSPTFSRADLHKLAEEKEVIRADSEKWALEHEYDDENSDMNDDENSDANDNENDDSAFEGYEEAMRLEGYEADEQSDNDKN